MSKNKSHTMKTHPQRGQIALLREAIGVRGLIDDAGVWWRTLLAAARHRPDIKVAETRIGDQVIEASLDSVDLRYEPFSGDIFVRDHRIVVFSPKRAILEIEGKQGQHSKYRHYTILGELGISRLLDNIAAGNPISKGFYDRAAGDRWSRLLMIVVALFGLWTIHSHFDLLRLFNSIVSMIGS